MAGKGGTQLVEVFEKASKAADKADDEGEDAEVARCVESLKEMRSIPVTTSLLMSTQVGKRLRKLTKHPRSKISSVAQAILDDWKKVVAAEATAKNGSTASANKKGSSIEPLKSPGSSKLEKVKMETTVEVKFTTSVSTVSTVSSVSSSKTVSVSTSPIQKIGSIPKTSDSARDRVREMLVEAFKKVENEVSEEDQATARSTDIVRMAVKVENGMFAKIGSSTSGNKLKYRSIMFNLKDANNPDLRRRVFLGEIHPEVLVTLSAEDLASDDRKFQIAKIKEKALFECERGLQSTASTDQFKCGKCHQRKTVYFQMQIRSADEPMTTFVTCVNCNNRWKFC